MSLLLDCAVPKDTIRCREADTGPCPKGHGVQVPRAAKRASPPQAQRGGDAREALPPSSNTGGKSQITAAIIDWCTATFAFQIERMPALLRAMSWAVGYELRAVEQRKQNGFADGLVVHAWREGEFVELCVVCWGGEQQKGRGMINVSGKSCGVIGDWHAWADLLEQLPEAKLTRVDVAVDLHDGQQTVDDALAWVEGGRFNCSGRNPSTRVDGDWVPMLNGDGRGTEGRTLYIGKAKNGKGLRVYEKGKQLGQVDSLWNRFEVQFGNRDRVIPFDVLTDPTRFFVAAYPALEEVVEAAGERIATISNTAAITVAKILTWMRSSAGKWLNLVVDAGVPIADLIEEVRVHETPRRIHPSAVAAGLLPAATRAGFNTWKETRCLTRESR